MSVLSLVNPGTLLGQGIRDVLGARGFQHEVRLLASEADAEGTLTEIDGEVALVHSLSRQALTGSDLVIVCGTVAEQRQAVALVPEATPTIVLANRIERHEGVPAVAGITESEALDVPVVVSPHPAVVGLCHLIAPLTDQRPLSVAATVLLPTSIHDAAGLDELFAQTRDILNFQSDPPLEVFGRQLAFNVLPGDPGSSLATDVATVLGSTARIAVRLLQAPVFHGLAISAVVQLEQEADVDELLSALHGSRSVVVAEPADRLGPIDAAARDELLVGPIEPVDGWPGAYSIWAVMDNLTRGGAGNAVELATQILG